MTTFYLYNLVDHIVAELDASGQTQREYIWADDMPAAVVDGVSTATPTLSYVHVDHLMRPILMTAQDRSKMWEARYAPFGATTYLSSTPATMDLRFPGQWFQLETGLAYNWHRYCDATTGRYIQPDPLVVDDGEPSVNGLATDVFRETRSKYKEEITKGFGWKSELKVLNFNSVSSIFLLGGTSGYGYASLNPLAKVDPTGLAPKDKKLGFPNLFWRWYHRCIKQPGDPDLDYEGACYWPQEWCNLGKPSPP